MAKYGIYMIVGSYESPYSMCKEQDLAGVQEWTRDWLIRVHKKPETLHPNQPRIWNGSNKLVIRRVKD